MGIVFGKQRDTVQVLTLKTTQSLPAIRVDRKFANNSELSQKTRSTSYQTTLPGLPNLISSDEEEDERGIAQVPPPFTLPPLSQRMALMGDFSTNVGSTPKVVAELSSSSDEEKYSSCVEDLNTHLQREKTIVIQEILGTRPEEWRSGNKDFKPLSSRESMKLLSSRDSYRKTCLRSRKRARKNSCISEDSSLTNSHIWSREEDTLSPSGDETVSDVRALITDTPIKRTLVGCKISRKSTINPGVRFNSSSDEGLPEFAIRYHLSKRDRRTRRDRIEGRVKVNSVVTEQVMPNSRTKSGARVSSAWHGQANRTHDSKKHSLLVEEDSYDAASEQSSSASEDELNYSTRFKTNPFLNLGSSAFFDKHRSSMGLQQANLYSRPRPGSLRPVSVRPKSKQPRDMRPDIIHILPNYAKSSYNDGPKPSAPDSHIRSLRRSKTMAGRQKAVEAPLPKIKPPNENTPSSSSSWSPKDLTTSPRVTDSHDLSPRAQFMIYKPPEVEPEKPRKQNDDFDDLDSAVEMFKLLL